MRLIFEKKDHGRWAYFFAGINRISNNDALGAKPCQKVVQTRLQIPQFTYEAWRSDCRYIVFSCRVALARSVPVPRMDREALLYKSARVLQAWPKAYVLAVSSISIRIRRFGLILYKALRVPWSLFRQRRRVLVFCFDLVSSHGSSNRKISSCQRVPNDRRLLSRFRRYNDTNRVVCSNDLFPHRLCASADKRRLSKQLRLIRRLLIANLFNTIFNPTI